jgi:3-oxoacyl-[acyl-carrier protein] reductase
VCAAVAGIWPVEDVPVAELPLARWRETVDANLTATFLTARGFLRVVERNGHGALVLVGSPAGLVGAAGHADYAAAKSAITGGLLLSLKNEAVRRNPRVRVNAVAPGWTVSPMTRGVLDDEREVDRLFAEARSALGRIDVCAAVAGVWPSPDVPVWELPLERWEQTVRQNLTSTFLTARGFLREVERTGHGSLVLIGSTAGLVGEAGHADYAAAKSAVLGGLLLSLKNEVVRIAPRARVNAVAPGWTETPMTRGHVDPEAVRKVTRTMALRKIAEPDDVARQVVVLASDELSGHVTGQVVTVAGGMEGRVLHGDQ